MIDFGWLQHDANTPAKTKVGTPVYMAPEIIMADQRYDAKVSCPFCCLLTSVLCSAGAVHISFESVNAGKLEPHVMHSKVLGFFVTKKQVLHGLYSTVCTAVIVHVMAEKEDTA